MGPLFAGDRRLSQDDEAGCGCGDCRSGEGDHDRPDFAAATPCSADAMRTSGCADGSARRARRSKRPGLRREGGSPWPTSPEANQSLAFVLAMTGEARAGHQGGATGHRAQCELCRGLRGVGSCPGFRGDLEGGLLPAKGGTRQPTRTRAVPGCMTQWDTAISSWAIMKKRSRFRRRVFTKIRRSFGALVTLACAYAQGPPRRGQALCGRAAPQIPRYSLRALRKNPMIVDPKLVERLIESMALAGLPEGT